MSESTSYDEVPIRMDENELTEKLRKQLSFYFSRENLLYDTFLQGHLRDHGSVDFKTLMGFPSVASLSSDEELIKKALHMIDNVVVDDKTQTVKLVPTRNVLMLYQVPRHTTADEVRELFTRKDDDGLDQGPQVVDVEKLEDSTYYVTFVDENAARAALDMVMQGTIHGQNVRARMKNKPLSRSTADYRRNVSMPTGQNMLSPTADQTSQLSPHLATQINGVAADGQPSAGASDFADSGPHGAAFPITGSAPPASGANLIFQQNNQQSEAGTTASAADETSASEATTASAAAPAAVPATSNTRNAAQQMMTVTHSAANSQTGSAQLLTTIESHAGTVAQPAATVYPGASFLSAAGVQATGGPFLVGGPASYQPRLIAPPAAPGQAGHAPANFQSPQAAPFAALQIPPPLVNQQQQQQQQAVSRNLFSVGGPAPQQPHQQSHQQPVGAVQPGTHFSNQRGSAAGPNRAHQPMVSQPSGRNATATAAAVNQTRPFEMGRQLSTTSNTSGAGGLDDSQNSSNNGGANSLGASLNASTIGAGQMTSAVSLIGPPGWFLPGGNVGQAYLHQFGQPGVGLPMSIGQYPPTQFIQTAAGSGPFLAAHGGSTAAFPTAVPAFGGVPTSMAHSMHAQQLAYGTAFQTPFSSAIGHTPTSAVVSSSQQLNYHAHAAGQLTAASQLAAGATQPVSQAPPTGQQQHAAGAPQQHAAGAQQQHATGGQQHVVSSQQHASNSQQQQPNAPAQQSSSQAQVGVPAAVQSEAADQDDGQGSANGRRQPAQSSGHVGTQELVTAPLSTLNPMSAVVNQQLELNQTPSSVAGHPIFPHMLASNVPAQQAQHASLSGLLMPHSAHPNAHPSTHPSTHPNVHPNVHPGAHPNAHPPSLTRPDASSSQGAHSRSSTSDEFNVSAGSGAVGPGTTGSGPSRRPQIGPGQPSTDGSSNGNFNTQGYTHRTDLQHGRNYQQGPPGWGAAGGPPPGPAQQAPPPFAQNFVGHQMLHAGLRGGPDLMRPANSSGYGLSHGGSAHSSSAHGASAASGGGSGGAGGGAGGGNRRRGNGPQNDGGSRQYPMSAGSRGGYGMQSAAGVQSAPGMQSAPNFRPGSGALTLTGLENTGPGPHHQRPADYREHGYFTGNSLSSDGGPPSKAYNEPMRGPHNQGYSDQRTRQTDRSGQATGSARRTSADSASSNSAYAGGSRDVGGARDTGRDGTSHGRSHHAAGMGASSKGVRGSSSSVDAVHGGHEEFGYREERMARSQQFGSSNEPLQQRPPRMNTMGGGGAGERRRNTGQGSQGHGGLSSGELRRGGGGGRYGGGESNIGRSDRESGGRARAGGQQRSGRNDAQMGDLVGDLGDTPSGRRGGGRDKRERDRDLDPRQPGSAREPAPTGNDFQLEMNSFPPLGAAQAPADKALQPSNGGRDNQPAKGQQQQARVTGAGGPATGASSARAQSQSSGPSQAAGAPSRSAPLRPSAGASGSREGSVGSTGDSSRDRYSRSGPAGGAASGGPDRDQQSRDRAPPHRPSDSPSQPPDEQYSKTSSHLKDAKLTRMSRGADHGPNAPSNSSAGPTTAGAAASAAGGASSTSSQRGAPSCGQSGQTVRTGGNTSSVDPSTENSSSESRQTASNANNAVVSSTSNAALPVPTYSQVVLSKPTSTPSTGSNSTATTSTSTGPVSTSSTLISSAPTTTWPAEKARGPSPTSTTQSIVEADATGQSSTRLDTADSQMAQAMAPLPKRTSNAPSSAEALEPAVAKRVSSQDPPASCAVGGASTTGTGGGSSVAKTSSDTGQQQPAEKCRSNGPVTGADD